MSLAKTIACSAVGGMLVGLVACSNSKPAENADGDATAKPADTTAPAVADCCKGKNECEGKGDCAVEGKQDCKGMNKCKGQGGCNKRCQG